MSRSRIGNLEFVEEDGRLSFGFHPRFVLKTILILGPAALLSGAALAYGAWNILRGQFELFIVDMLFCILGGAFLPLTLKGLLHVIRYGRGWFIIDKRMGSFTEPGWFGARRSLEIDSIEAVLIECKRSSDSEGENESDLVALRLRGQEKPYFPWGRFGGPDRVAEAVGMIAGFLGVTATDHSRSEQCPN